jgi:nucleoid-associated protein YgaU
MTDHPGNTSRGGNGGNLLVAFVLAAGAIAGAIYLGYQNPDWTGNLFSPRQAAIQPPPAQAPSPANLAPSFDAITADAGMLVAAGKAQPGATVLLQNGGQTLGETKADENGEWVIMLERPLPAGPYNLSLLSIDPKTQARVPGARSYALTIAPQDKKAPAPAQGVAAATPPAGKAAGTASATVSASTSAARQQAKKPAAVKAVKPGDTLWAIAEQYYGRGMGARYGEIASANKDQIKNPNLIFPNQQFAIPGK